MSPRCIKAFESIGADKIEKIKHSDSFVIIGIKGTAAPASIKQALASPSKTNGVR